MPRKLLLVDDSPFGLGELKFVLEKQGVSLTSAPDQETALYQITSRLFDVVLIGMELKGVAGLTVVQKIRQIPDTMRRHVGIIMMSAKRERTIEEVNLLKELGGLEVIPKPFKPVQLLPFMQRAFQAMQNDINFEIMVEKDIGHLIKASKFDEAIEIIKKKIATVGPRGTDLIIDLYEKAKRFQEALVLVDALLAKPNNLNNTKYHNLRGRLLMEMGKMGEAKKSLEKADELAPKNLQRMENMSTVYLETDEPDKAVSTMKELCQENPEKPDMKFEMFDKLSQKGFDEHAVAYCRETTPVDEVIRYYNNKGVEDSKAGKYAQALLKYNEALKFYPNHRQYHRIHWNIAIAIINERQEGYIQRAVKALETSLALEPTFKKATELVKKLKSSDAKKGVSVDSGDSSENI